MNSRGTQTLNAAQQRAVNHGGGGAAAAGPLLVIAGAGTGKTGTLAHRVARLMQQGMDPQRLLLLTFSRRAAAELERRVGRVLQAQLGALRGERPRVLEWAGTFHSVGARILREYAERIGLAPSFTIHDRGDSEDLMAMVRHDHLGVDPLKGRFPGAATCVAVYSRSVNSEAPLAEVLQTTYPWCAGWEGELRRLFDAYVAAKQAQQVLDFDDLLLYWAAMMGVPALAEEVGARFDHVLVDEYQDTNRLQGSILRALKPDGRGVTVVGDDAQSIYGFRAATVRNILDFPRQYDPPAEVITLERNYRSTAPILDASNAVIALAKERYAKNLVTDRSGGERPRLVTVADEMAQAQYVAEQVLLHRENGIALKRQAVLFRTSSHSALLELELARRNIPFVKFGGLRFLDAAHVKDVLSLLRWIENPRGRLAGFRTLRLLPGVGPAIAGRCLDALAPAIDTLAAMRGFTIPAAAAQDWPGLLRLCETLRGERSDWPSELDALLAWYEPQLDRLYEDAAIRAPDLAQLRRIASTLCDSRAFPHGADAGPARGDLGRGRRSAARRGLPDALDDPLCERPGVAGRAGPELRRWLHSLRHGDRKRRGDRGGAPPALRRDDPGDGPLVAGHAAALPRAATGRNGRPSCLCVGEPFPDQRRVRAFRPPELAAGGGAGRGGAATRPQRGSARTGSWRVGARWYRQDLSGYP